MANLVARTCLSHVAQKKQRWLVNPDSGYELAEFRQRTPDFPCYLRVPGRAFWEAVGFDDPLTVKTCKLDFKEDPEQRYGGWLNKDRWRDTWSRTDYCDAQDEINRQLTHWSDNRRREEGRSHSPATPRRYG